MTIIKTKNRTPQAPSPTPISRDPGVASDLISSIVSVSITSSTKIEYEFCVKIFYLYFLHKYESENNSVIFFYFRGPKSLTRHAS